jgi:hypothetical protein
MEQVNDPSGHRAHLQAHVTLVEEDGVFSNYILRVGDSLHVHHSIGVPGGNILMDPKDLLKRLGFVEEKPV